MKAEIEFVKMQGCGNDYVYIDCFDKNTEDPSRLAAVIADRHFGVGGDGLVLICRSEAADAEMRMFNADGSEGKMCGNAIRCVGKYLFDTGRVPKTEMTVATKSGIKTLFLTVEEGAVRSVRVDMGRAVFNCERIPVRFGDSADVEQAVDYPLSVGGREYRVTCVSMGNPHCVVFVPDPDCVELERLGPLFENNSAFPERINTEFVSVKGENRLKMRVWERGSGETLACGTGACASVAAAVKNRFCRAGEPVCVELRGGELTVTYTDGGVTLEGPAEFVFKGAFDYDKQ